MSLSGAALGVDQALDGTADLAVSELRLGLTLELRLHDLDGQDGDQPFAHIITAQGGIGLLENVVLLRVAVDRSRQRALEAGKVRSTLMRVDVVDEGEGVLVVPIRVLHAELDLDVVLAGSRRTARCRPRSGTRRSLRRFAGP